METFWTTVWGRGVRWLHAIMDIMSPGPDRLIIRLDVRVEKEDGMLVAQFPALRWSTWDRDLVSLLADTPRAVVDYFREHAERGLLAEVFTRLRVPVEQREFTIELSFDIPAALVTAERLSVVTHVTQQVPVSLAA